MPYLTKRQRINLSQLSIDKGYESAVSVLADSDVFIVHDSSSFDNAPVSASAIKTYAESARASNPIYLYDSAVYLSSPRDGQARLQADNSAQITGSVVVLTSTTNESGSIWLHANGGTSESILLRSDQGTGAGSIQLLSDAGGITIQAETDIILDADGEDVVLKDGGTEVGSFSMASSNLSIKSAVSDKDIIFMGNDGGSAITALTLDMSDAGNATFNGSLTAATSLTIGSAVMSEADLEQLDDLTAGTVTASKAVVVDSNKDIASFRNITLTGELDAGSLDVSGDIDIDGTANLDAVDIDGAVQIDGATTFGVDDTGVDVKFFGATSGRFMLFDESRDALAFTDNTKLEVGTGADLSLYHDGTNSYIANAVGALKIATETSGIAVTIGHGTSEVTVADNLTVSGNHTVTGNLVVNGTTTTVNSTTVTIDDPIFTLGGDSAPGSDDNKDRGIEFRYHDGSSARVGFFGWDDSTGRFSVLKEATNSSEVFSGTGVSIQGASFFTGTTEMVTTDGAAKVQSAVAGDGLAHSAGVLSVSLDSHGGLTTSGDEVSFRGIAQQIFMSASASGTTQVTHGHYVLSGSTKRLHHALLNTTLGTVHSSSSPEVYLNGMLLRSGSTGFAYNAHPAEPGAAKWAADQGDDYIFIQNSCSSGNGGQRIILSSSLDPDDVLTVRWVRGGTAPS